MVSPFYAHSRLFCSENLLIGTGIPFSINYASVGQSGSYFQGDDALNTSLGLSPFIRYYFGENCLKPYLGGSYSYLHKTYKYTHSTVPIPICRLLPIQRW